MEWKEYKLKELCLKIGSGATPSGGKEAYKGGDYNLVRSQNVLDFEFSRDGLAQINDQQASELRNVELKAGDVLLNITGDSVARACLIPNSVLPARVNQHVAIVRADQTKLDNHFLLYFLQREKRKLLNMSSGGATRKALTKAMIEDFPISLPSLEDQRRIASILSSLDRKIELNNQINKQLEEMAQAIFKSWFIDFEPFKDGEFVDSELGRIPKGWRVGTLSNICGIEKKSINPQKTPDVVYSHYSLPAFDAGKLPVKQKGNEIMSNKFQFSEGTILLSKLNPNIKRIWYVKDLEENAICSTEFIPLTPKESCFLPFLLATLNNESFYSKLLGGVSGATNSHQRLTPDDVLKQAIVYDPEAVGKYFEVSKEMLATMNSNIQQNRDLSTLRDTLLPKLMSGEINLEQYGNQ